MDLMNYLKIFEDGTSEAVDVKPSWGMYEKEHALDNREVYIDGNWYSTTGGELVTNGTFDSDVSGWIGYPGRSATIVTENQRAKITSIATSGSGVYTAIPTEIGVEYTITAYMESPSVTVVLEIFTSNTCVEGGQLALPAILGAAETEYVESTFVAETAISYIGLRVATGTAGFLLYADNISVYKAEPTIDTLQPPHTYLSNKGKLAGIEVANGAPVDIHYDELAPTLVEDTIKAGNLVVIDGFDLGQSWVDVTSERVEDINYPNNYGKPIMVIVNALNRSAGDILYFYINGTIVARFGLGTSGVNTFSSVQVIVPNGDNYKFSSTETAPDISVFELR